VGTVEAVYGVRGRVKAWSALLGGIRVDPPGHPSRTRQTAAARVLQEYHHHRANRR
jgi:hypothetical protein